MKVSEQDAARIAVRARVALSTVRRVLSGAPHVAPCTRARVVEVCHELRFPVPPAVEAAPMAARDDEGDDSAPRPLPF